jgi:small GTP-binding protein
MIRKVKVCLIGAAAVGKSSLLARYVSSIFSERYRTTIGVRVETRVVVREGKTLELVLWDMNGEDEFQTVQASYLRGASAYILVIDGTRPETIDVATALSARVRSVVGPVPFVVVLNKADLVAAWEIPPREIEAMKRMGWCVVTTSAKTGAGVEEVFEELADLLLRSKPWSEASCSPPSRG